MDLNLIKRLVKIVNSSDITDLEVQEDGLKVKISKKIRGTQIVTHSHLQPAPVQEAAKAQPETLPAEIESKTENQHEIKSPIVGTFYRAPAPDADPYVQIGDIVSPGTVLCIVEAMKLMNEIESDVSGKIIKILVENGKPVEYSQPLFLIQTA
jgi:acetyl-CoA carboxylase biotin carboxyl carrier protein